MGNLISSLVGSATAMRAMERQFSTIQNNVANASTPGYARVRQTIHALPFDPAHGLAGGMEAGPGLSDRSSYAEQAVWQRNSLYSAADAKASSLRQVETSFDIGDSGLPRALSDLFAGFSRLAVNPSDRVGRQDIIDKAGSVAASFRDSAAALASASSNNDREIASVVGRINELSAVVARRNAAVKSDFRAASDAALDADTYNALEELAGLTDFCAVRDSDGTLNIYMGDQSPLVLGGDVFALKADFSSSDGALLDRYGADVSGVVRSGKLGALLDLKRNALPGYAADLDALASALADTVNGQLAAGLDSAGNPGAPLFAYDPAHAAATMAVAAIAPADIAAAAAGAPGGNGNALDLAALQNKPLAGGATFAGAYGALASRVGADLSVATADRDRGESLLAQARALRQEASGVSLDEEASMLMQIQRQYQAAGKLIAVLNDLAETILSVVR